MSGRAAVVVLVLAAVMLASGCIDPGEPVPPRASISAPNLDVRSANNTTVWDCTFNITRISPSNYRVSWGELRVMVKSAQGGLLIPAVTADPYPGPDLWSPTVYRIERAGSWLTMDVGDAVMLGAINGTYEEAEIELSIGGTLLTYARLPSVFPS